MVYTDAPALLALGVPMLLLTIAGCLWPDYVPYSTLLIPMFLGSLWLGPRTLPWFVVAALVCVSVMIAFTPPIESPQVIMVVVTFALGFLILLVSFSRTRLGIAGPKGESMLVDLRDRIMRQARIATLPDQWYAKSVLRSSGGTLFAGDFIVADADVSDGVLSVVVVDVSGKGVEAGTRSLLLSGAFGGLLAAVPTENFLPAANKYLLRQNWAEGFATAIQLHLDQAVGVEHQRVAGRGQRLLQTGFEGAEVQLVDELERSDDDRALLLVHRRWPGKG